MLMKEQCKSTHLVELKISYYIGQVQIHVVVHMQVNSLINNHPHQVSLQKNVVYLWFSLFFDFDNISALSVTI